MTLSYHLSINKEKRPQQYRPSGLLKNPDKFNTRILCSNSSGTFNRSHQGIATSNSKYNGNVLYSLEKRTCALPVSFTCPSLQKNMGIKKWNLHLVGQKFKKLVYLPKNTRRRPLVGRGDLLKNVSYTWRKRSYEFFYQKIKDNPLGVEIDCMT